MFIDGRELPADHVVETDICIIGAGAVGISMALEFINSNVSVTLIESGGFEFDPQTQSLYQGHHIGVPTYPLETNRLRYFGGTTNHWAGHCRPFDEFDFQIRDWIPHSGWPITIDEMKPYFARSQPIMDLGEYNYDSIEEYAKKLKLKTLPLDNERLKTVMKHQSPPVRFGERYRDDIGKSKNVTVYLNSNALELNTEESASHVTDIDVACIDGPRYKVKARQFVLATGGLENPRLMLLSNSTAPNGLGNDHDMVGRFYTDHLLVRPAMDISLSHLDSDFRLYTDLHNINGGTIFAIMTPPAALTKKEKMTRFRFHLYPYQPHYTSAVGGVFSKIDQSEKVSPLSLAKGTSIQVHMAMEPIPNPDALVRLSNDQDILGQRKLEVNWVLSEQELANARRAIEICALEFGRMGLGRASAPLLEKPDQWPREFSSGKHHCGTTRMANNPKQGVIDSNTRVFGIDNLFVTGSSIFPTIGHTNPTLNLIAFSLRLADHLKDKLA